MTAELQKTNIEASLEPFDQALARHNLKLERDSTHTLQVNVGFLCNLACRHCHLEAGPQRREVMTLETMNAVIDYASRVRFETIDVTGGAPELVPHIEYFLVRLAQRTKRLIVRTNLVALQSEETFGLMRLYRDLRVTLVASLPSTNATQADSQRGKGVWEKSIAVLKELNSLGYGHPGTGLELDLVANPAGAFLPADQLQTEKKYRRDLLRNGIVFSSLFIFANAPLGRFRTWLEQSGNLEGYLRTLAERFNPAVVCGLMCRSLISVSWDGYLYDCDFNIAAGLHHGPGKVHISGMEGLPEEGTAIPTGYHCYACTAGSGFT
jgi:radical SAM/Cys-rich protein